MDQDIVRFSFPTTVDFGPGAVNNLPECLKEVGISNPLLVTDPVIAKLDFFDSISKVLKNASVSFVVFDMVHPNPLIEDIDDAVRLYKAENCDGIIGLGGGSPIDAAKVVAVLAVNPAPLTQYDIMAPKKTDIKGLLPPIIAIPTTAGTGSEVGRCSVITNTAKNAKFLVCNPQMLPARAILDPLLTVALPPMLTAGTGMDALTHNIEALVVDTFHPMCDAIALKGIELVAENLEKAVKNPTDIKARGNMMVAAMMGAVAFQKDLGAAHSLAHPLSTLCNIPHGMANAICLPYVMRFNAEVSANLYAKVARCFGIDTSNLSDMQAAERAIQAVIDLNTRIGIPPTLADAGATQDQLENLAKKAFDDPSHGSNPRTCTQADLLMLYQQAFKGQLS